MVEIKMTEELKDLLNERRIIAFVGSGVSKAADKEMPTWNELFNELQNDLPEYKESINKSKGSGDWLKFFEIYREVKGKNALFERIKELTDRQHPDILSSRYHVSLLELPIKTFYTTNFDSFLEQAFEAANRPFNKIITLEDIGKRDPAIHDIVKFHGDFSVTESLVITEAQYHERLSFRNELDILLRADALGRGLLFLGYSFGDPNVRYLFRGLKELGVGKKTPKSFFIAPKLTALDAKSLELYGIKAVHFSVKDDYSDMYKVYDWLENLIEQTRKSFYERSIERIFQGFPKQILTFLRFQDLQKFLENPKNKDEEKIYYLRETLDATYVPSSLWNDFEKWVKGAFEGDLKFTVKENLAISLHHMGNPLFLLPVHSLLLEQEESDLSTWHPLKHSAYYFTDDNKIAGGFLELIVGYLHRRISDREFITSLHAERVVDFAEEYRHGLDSFENDKRQTFEEVLNHYKEKNPRLRHRPSFIKRGYREILTELLNKMPRKFNK